MPNLGKYRHAFLTGLQSNLVYRWNFGLRATFSLLHLVFIFVLWGAVYEGQTEVAGFSLAATLTYFIVLLVLQFFVGAFNEDYQISEDIRSGMINQFLLKPINYFAYRFSVFVAARLISGLLALIPVLLAIPLFKDQLTFPAEGWRLAVGIPAIFLAAFIQFTIAYCFGLLAFWFLEIQSFIILSLAVETVLGGQIFPLDLLPKGVYAVSQFLPYYYQMYFPAAILTGRIQTLGEAVIGLGIQAVWAVILFGLSYILWTRGLRRHTAAGG